MKGLKDGRRGHTHTSAASLPTDRAACTPYIGKLSTIGRPRGQRATTVRPRRLPHSGGTSDRSLSHSVAPRSRQLLSSYATSASDIANTDSREEFTTSQHPRHDHQVSPAQETNHVHLDPHCRPTEESLDIQRADVHPYEI